MNIITKLALEKILNGVPIKRPGQADMTPREIELVFYVHTDALRIPRETAEEFMLGGDI